MNNTQRSSGKHEESRVEYSRVQHQQAVPISGASIQSHNPLDQRDGSPSSYIGKEEAHKQEADWVETEIRQREARTHIQRDRQRRDAQTVRRVVLVVSSERSRKLEKIVRDTVKAAHL